jgi:hypothetical protein
VRGEPSIHHHYSPEKEAHDQVAKVELARIRQTRAFDLQLWNIRAPPAEADAKEAKRWRRLYQYDIVSRETAGGACVSVRAKSHSLCCI